MVLCVAHVLFVEMRRITLPQESFPPTYFGPVHVVKEIAILGPIFLHNMFPFERLLGVLKKYVHNCAWPEGSICKGYLTEEVIEFCVDIVLDLSPIGVPQSRHVGRLSGKGTLGINQQYVWMNNF
jgi:hypothetical protein